MLRRLLELIGDAGERGRIKSQIGTSGGHVRSQLRALIDSGCVEWVIKRSEHRSRCVPTDTQ